MHPETQGRNAETLSQQLAELGQSGIAELKERWRSIYGTQPHRRISRELLTRALAYRIQEESFGGLKPATRKLLERIAGDASSRIPIRAPAPRRASAGTVLIREWRGSSHQVMVLDDGAVYRGRRYRSLSEVARFITGAHWSGPLFFGLKSLTKENSHGSN
jgi:hypothetical protein